MKREQIIEMAREAGLPSPKKCCQEFTEQLDRFADLVAAAEREECAKLEHEAGVYTKHDMAAAIRARGETK
jgi:protein-tyrosine-phosphatase